MFTGELLEFQDRHERSLLEKYRYTQDVILAAPTGSGKTVIVSKFIDDWLEEHPDTIFFWLCPGAGALHEQSSSSFERFINGISIGDLDDFLRDMNPSGKIFFINWDKINNRTNVVRQDGERANLFDAIFNLRSKGLSSFLIIDEEHKFQKAADRFEQDLRPEFVMRISATPATKGVNENIPDYEVIQSGLIASGISINENLEESLEYNGGQDDDLLLLELADEKRKAILREYNANNIPIRPLVLIQFPAGRPEWIERVKTKLTNMGYGTNSGLIDTWMANEHPEDESELKRLDGQTAFLLMKQAVSTGWDCPRAKILVKLREGGTERFQVQTVGRIRRMPEKKHYDNEILDNCYVYTLDPEYQTGLTASLSDSFFSATYKIKNSPSLFLKAERIEREARYIEDDVKIIKALNDKILCVNDIIWTMTNAFPKN